MSLGKEVTILYAVTNGYLDDVPVEKVATFEQSLHRFMESNEPEIIKNIENDKEIKPETEQALKEALSEFKKSVTY
jgi:F-type H+-transporting ATPase subunit alpha